MKKKPTLEQALTKRLGEIGLKFKHQDVPQVLWHRFIYSGWILLVYKNHPSCGKEKDRAAVGFFDPTQ